MHEEEKSIKQLTLFYIGNGSKTKKELIFKLGIEKIFLDKVLNEFVAKKMILFNNDKITPTLKGLLSIAHSIPKQYLASCVSRNKKMWFTYVNPFKKDIIFLPNLGFDERNNYFEDDSVRLYKTRLDLSFADIRVLNLIENLLEANFFEPQGGFWILKSRKNFCGFETDNLFKTIKQNNLTDYEIKIAFSDYTFILIVTVKVQNRQTGIFELNFYLSNCGETPYVDVLKDLDNRLRILLNFFAVENIPLGKETVIKTNYSLLNGFRGSFDFHSVVDGKIYVTDLSQHSREAIPQKDLDVIVVNPHKMQGKFDLKKISPWFISGGSFGDECFTDKELFRKQWFENYYLDEAIVIQFMIDLCRG